MEEVDKEKVLDKIKKLQAMLTATPAEAENARRLIQTLITKYQLHPDEVNPPRKFITIKVHRLKKYAYPLASYMKVDISPIAGHPDYIGVRLTPDEYKMYYCLLDEIKHIFNKKEREFSAMGRGLPWKNAALKSFMYGYMRTNYPYDKDLCTSCKVGKLEVIEDGKLKCDKCGAVYTTKSGFRKTGWVGEAFNQGMATNTKSLDFGRDQLGFKG
jgi:ribosomal protein L37AE/L43A